MRRIASGLAALSALFAWTAIVQADDLRDPEVRTAPERHAGFGIWKAAVPPVQMKAEFGGHDPLGLAAGSKIKADCSINWTDPDTGKLYCFSSATSQSVFQDWPRDNIERARKAWHTLGHSGS